MPGHCSVPTSAPAPGSRGILFQDEACEVTLMDIPTSIAVAQGNPEGMLRSSAPLEEPQVLSHEPKSQKAKEKHAVYSSKPLHDEYKAAVETALSKIRGHTLGMPWCLPRKVMTEVRRSKKSDMDVDHPEKELDARLREWSELKEVDEPFIFEKMMATLTEAADPNATSSETVTHPWLMSYKPVCETPGEQPETGSVPPQEPWKSSFHNPADHAEELTIFENPSQAKGSAQYRFRIPPRSSLFLSDSTHSDEFRASFRRLTEEYTLPRHFDFILMDPPWPSASARRKGNYEQVGGMRYMKRMLTLMDIDNYIEHNGLVGIWITNKESLRDHVLGPGGLFEKWNVGFIEEWIWIKTTVKGETAFTMDSEWRKPYEVLLLGRAAPNPWTTMTHATDIKRRVIAAVPDVHSRKPCIKELIEPMLTDPNDYSALEIFARYLVAGWTSWGNEVLKFNWDQYWAEDNNGSTSIV